MPDSQSTEADAAVQPLGVNHLVLTVTDLERSHRFWTEILGFRHVGTLERRPDASSAMPMRFYAGSRGNHHDLALVQVQGGPVAEPADDNTMRGRNPGFNHVAIDYPDRETWLRQIRFLHNRGVPFKARVNHGMSHSVYITDPDGHGVEVIYNLPPERWEGDVNAALNYLERLPREGAEALVDEETPVFS